MNDALGCTVVIAVWLVLLAIARRWVNRDEQMLLQVAFVMHVVSVFAQVWITRDYYGLGDMLTYWQNGQLLAKGLRTNFEDFAPELLKLIFQRDDVRLPFEVIGSGSSTGTLCGLSGFLMLLTADSLYAGCMVVSMGTFWATFVIYFVLRRYFPDVLRNRILIATMLIPSVVFWSSALLKESFAIMGLALLIVALERLDRAKWLQAALLIALGALVVGLLKPYVLYPFALATGVWLYWNRSIQRNAPITVKPVYLVLGAALAIVGVVLLGRFFPEFAVDRLAHETADLQVAGGEVGGGSYYSIVDDPQPNPALQLVFAPIALLTCLFRPALFDVRNPQMFVNALETTVLLVLLIRSLWRHSWAGVRAQISRSPILVFCVVFTVTFGVAVGLASTNLGTLSRYRIPMMPFFALTLMVTSAARAATATRSTEDHLGQGSAAGPA